MYNAACVYSLWNDKDNAFAALDRGLAIRDPGLIYLRGSVIAGFLEDDPRFDELLERLGLN